MLSDAPFNESLIMNRSHSFPLSFNIGLSASFAAFLLSTAPFIANAVIRPNDFCDHQNYQVVNLSHSPLQIRSIAELHKQHQNVKLIVNNDRISPADLQQIANNGAILIIYTATTNISPRDIHNIQISSGNVGLVVNSDRISPRDLQNIANAGAQLLIDLQATNISARDIQNIQTSSGNVAIIPNSHRMSSQNLESLIRQGVRTGRGCS
jgi:hypothetical protein